MGAPAPADRDPPHAAVPVEHLKREALDYLRAQLRDRAPAQLAFEAAFDEAPLEDEGRALVFSFVLRSRTDPQERHYVVVGRTTPNYFPAYDLDPDDAYSLHIGTRFMLELRVAQVDPSEEPPDARTKLRDAVRRAAGEAAAQSEALAGLYRVGDALYAVYRVRLAGEEVYVMGADCPAGFYRLAQWPPQVALRLHLGRLIRAEGRGA